ncbi:MAG TPA: hypothetical protein VHE35_19760, partial [Kofleriaceae bacterium]|nr:hypothetical protein [Kofleriaceae bacterium]
PAPAAAAPPPAAAPPSKLQSGPARGRKADTAGGGLSAPIGLEPYHVRLAALIDALERSLTAGVSAAIVRLPIERLGELLEDLQSIGADDLARRIAPIVDRLRGVLGDTAAALQAALVTAIAELRAVLPGVSPPPRPASRGAFWK